MTLMEVNQEEGYSTQEEINHIDSDDGLYLDNFPDPFVNVPQQAMPCNLY